MPLVKSLFSSIPLNELIIVPLNGILQVDIEYSVPNRVRNSITSMLFRITNSGTTATAATDTTDALATGFGFVLPRSATATASAAAAATAGAALAAGATLPGAAPPVTVPAVLTAGGIPSAAVGATYAVFKALDFSNLLYENFVQRMTAVQSKEVVYRKVEITAYQVFSWTSEGVTVNGGKSKMTTYETHRFKTGAITGTLDRPVKDHKALVFLMYGVGNTNAYDKPSRFLVSGSPFNSYAEAANETTVGALYDAMVNGLNLTRRSTGTTPDVTSINFVPVIATIGEFRQIQVIQFEGVSNVAGSKIDRTK